MAEIRLEKDSFLVSETDTKGNIRFANDDFIAVSGYSKEELLGKPHNIIRHKDMPKDAFKDLWSTIERGSIWSGYVKNLAKNGDFYWVYATIFPVHNEKGERGYMSCRVKATDDEVHKAQELYKSML